MVLSFILDGGTIAVIFFAEVALLGTLEMIKEAVTFQEIEYSISPHWHCHRMIGPGICGG